MKAQFELAWYHFRMAFGMVFVAIGTRFMPNGSAERRTLIQATGPFEWEASK